MKVIDPADLAPGETPFSRYRDDNFPYCPACQRDQLVSALDSQTFYTEHRTYLRILAGLTCLYCGFSLLPGLNVNHEAIV